MKTLKRILPVLLFISLCAAASACTRQEEIFPATVTKTETVAADTSSQPTTAPQTAATTTVKPATTTVKPATTTVKPATTTAKPKATAKPTEKTTASLAAFEAEALRLTNREREKVGRKPLGTSAELQRCADIRAKEIRQKFSHTRPNGQSCFSLNPDLIMGENIAAGQNTPEEAVNGWMNSAAHRENILRERFTLCAVGCYYDKTNQTYYWVQLFA